MQRKVRLGRLAGVGAAITVAALVFVPGAGAIHNATEQTSLGPAGGNGAFDAEFRFASSDGTRAFFVTSEALVAADLDASPDVYERSGGATTLVSTGPAGGNGAFAADVKGISDDGSAVFFTAAEQLTSDDGDSSTDVYRRESGLTTLVSTAPGSGNGAFNAQFLLATPDGAHVVFSSAEQLVDDDDDSSTDSYVRSGVTTTLATTAPAAGNGAFDATARAISDDGNRVVFETAEQMTGTDGDSQVDLYERAGGTTQHVSTGPSGGNGAFDAEFNAASPNGLLVYFTTSEPLVASDTFSDCGHYETGTSPCPDIYQRAGGSTTLISGPQAGISGWPANFGQITANGTRVYFESGEHLGGGEDDFCAEDNEGDITGCDDVWKWETGSYQLVSPGSCSGGFEPFSYCDVDFNRATDGGSVFFTTKMALSPEDAENQDCVDLDQDFKCVDVYEYVEATGQLRLVSTGPTAGPTPMASAFAGSSYDGDHAFFTTARKMVAADTDASVDVYERYAGNTHLISTGPTGGNGAFAATFNDVSADGSRVFLTTSESLVAPDSDTRPDVYESRFASVPYARPKGASPIYASLVTAFKPCVTSNRTHGPPLAHPSCNPPVPESPNLAISAGETQLRSIGSLRMRVLAGAPGAPDDTDVQFTFSLTNVMKAIDFSEYSGEVRVRIGSRVTDREGGGTNSTIQDFPLSWTVPCAPTADPQIASACSSNTTLDAVVPGAAPEGTRAIWAFDQVAVDDGGPDEDADTLGNNSLFMKQGVFVP